MTKLVADGSTHLLSCIVRGTDNLGILDLTCPDVIFITSIMPSDMVIQYASELMGCTICPASQHSLVHDSKCNPLWKVFGQIWKELVNLCR